MTVFDRASDIEHHKVKHAARGAAMTPCSVSGCERMTRARGLCRMHYLRWHRHGHTDRLRKAPYASTEECFWTQVEKLPGGCWLWTGSVATNGYGLLPVRDANGLLVKRRAHRFAYELLVGPIPQGMTLDHHCHGPDCPGGTSCPHRRCVNPKHLRPASIGENARRSLKGRRQAALVPSPHKEPRSSDA